MNPPGPRCPMPRHRPISPGMSDEPLVQSVCGGPPVRVSEMVLRKGVFLPREDAQRIVDLGPAAAEPLLAMLERGTLSTVATAAMLLGALGDTRAVEPLE